MGSRKFQPRHTLRIISVGVFFVVLAAISVSFLTRSRRQVKVPEIAKELEAQKIDKKEQVEYREMKRDQESSEVLADRHYIGEDNLYHLEGNVKISFFNRSEGEDIVLRGDSIIHDAELTYFWLRGKATVEFKDLIMESSVLEYDAKKNVFKSDKTVRFHSEAITGSAQKCEYFMEKKKTELRGKVHLEIQTKKESPVPLEIDTEYLEYYDGRGLGKAEGGVELVHGKSRATANLLEFELAASREQIKSLFLKDMVTISLVDEFKRVEPFSAQKTLVLHGDKCLMRASSILIKGFVDSPQIQRLEANGGCSFRFIEESGSFTQIDGEEITFSLTKDGNLKDLIVQNKASITEEVKEKGYPRYIDGQRLYVQGDKNILIVEGKETLMARIRSRDSEITAQEIKLFLESNNLEANKDTKVILYPEKRPQGETSFFSSENPVFITATGMRYSEENKRFIFSGGTKLWQMKETIKAPEIFFGVETEAFRARGGVESVLPYQPKTKEEQESVWIESAVMEYNPEKKLILYRGKVKLKARDIDISAGFLTISLAEDSGEMKNIVARDNVVVKQKTYEGHGEEARFNIDEEIITVVGKPVLIDKNKGRTEGGKLTFYMADGRIVVENQDRERSVTVIKF
jgi:lipopolysaccharide export system protein LptA